MQQSRHIATYFVSGLRKCSNWVWCRISAALANGQHIEQRNFYRSRFLLYLYNWFYI